MKIRIYLFIFVFLSSYSITYPDRILLHDGREIEGVIQEETNESVTIQVRGAVISLPCSRIKTIGKSSEEEKALDNGDALFAAGKYEEALVEYQKALNSNLEDVEIKIARTEKEIRKQFTGELENELADKTPDEQIELLKSKLSDVHFSPTQRTVIRENLFRLLSDEIENARDFVDPSRMNELLRAAWTLFPEKREIAHRYITTLIARGEQNEQIVEVLKSHISAHPDDLEMMELLIEKDWESEPGFVLDILYKEGQLRPDATTKMKELYPEVLKACFYREIQPPETPLDPVSCYEHLMALEPTISPLPLLRYKVKENPSSPAAHLELGNYHYDREEWIDAIKALEESPSLQQNAQTSQLLRNAKEQFETTEFEKACKMMDAHQPVKAQERCEAILRIKSESLQTYILLQKARSVERCTECRGTGKIICPDCQGRGERVWTETRREYNFEVPESVSKNFEHWKEELEFKKVDKLEGRCKIYCKKCNKPITVSYRVYGSNIHEAQINAAVMGGAPSKCPHCGAPKGPIIRKIEKRKPCTHCDEKGFLGECKVCKGKGLIELETPRPVSVDTSIAEKLFKEQKEKSKATQKIPSEVLLPQTLTE